MHQPINTLNRDAMTLDELKTKKEILENLILGAVQQFENETRLQVSEVKIVAVHGGQSVYCYTAGVKTEIKL